MASQKRVIYEKVTDTLYTKDSKEGMLTVEKAMEILGWQAEKDTQLQFGKDFLFRDLDQKGANKIRLLNNETNRPFRMSLARRYANEILRGKWAFNGESFIVDHRGNVQDGQHRLVGLVLAEQLRKRDPERWKAHGVASPCKIEALVVQGIADKDEVVDTINLGQKRSLGDVLFRNRQFEGVSEKEQTGLANLLSGAIRVVWLRFGGMSVSDAPHFPHTEALEFLDQHSRIVECCKYIKEENGEGAEGNTIRSLLSLAYAAGMMYVMATCKTKADKFDAEGETALDFSMWDKASEFWTLFASGAALEKGSPILALRQFCTKADASGGQGRDDILAAIVLAWNAWIDDKKVAGVSDLKPKKAKNAAGKLQFVETPYIGGLDIFREKVKVADDKPVPAPKAEKVAKPPKPIKGKGPKAKGEKLPYAVGDEVWVKPNDKGVKPYKARIIDIAKNGVVEVGCEGDKDTYEVNPKDGDIISHEKPKAA